MQDHEILEKIIRMIGDDKSLPRQQEELAKDITDFLDSDGYVVKRMGSSIKNTQISGSDIDLLVLLDDNLEVHQTLNHFFTKLKSFNPNIGNHSVKINRNCAKVDIIPGYQINRDKYRIPNKSTNNWEVRGHSQFSEDFKRADSRISGKLSAVVKVMKLWKEHHNTFPLASLFLEKICYDNLHAVNLRITHKRATRRCFKRLSQRLRMQIPHPGDGRNLNILSEHEKQQWQRTIEKHDDQLKTYQLIKWQKILGPEFI